MSAARRRLRKDLAERLVPDVVIDDAVLILSELLSNACRHARPLEPVSERTHDAPQGGAAEAEQGQQAQQQTAQTILATRTANESGPGGSLYGGEDPGDDGRVVVGWELHSDGLLTVEVTDGGGPTRPRRGSPSLTARGGRGLGIVGQLASDWGVRDAPGEVTVWAVLPVRARHARRTDSLSDTG